MKINTLVILLAITAILVGGAFVVAPWGRAKSKSEVAADLLFPDLSGKINSVTSVTLKKANKELTFARGANGWELPTKGGYPAKVEKIVEVVRGLSQLRAVEPKTSKPENYSKIGVEDPGTAQPAKPSTPDAPAPESAATLVTLKDDKGQSVASVIIGNPKWEAKPGVYLRKAGEAQSWLADNRIDVPTELTQWVDSQLPGVAKDRMKQVELTFPDGSKTKVSKATKEDKAFTVHDIPAGEELASSNSGDPVADAITFMAFEDVAPASEIDFAGTKPSETSRPGASAEFQTFDGMKVLVQTYDQEGLAKDGKTKETKTWAHFVAAYDESAAPPPSPPPAEPKPGEPAPPTPPAAKKPEEVQKEVADYNAKMAKWAFQIPAYKASTFKTHVKDLLKSKPPTPPPSLNEGNAAAPMNPMPLPGMPPPQPSPAPQPAPTGPQPAETPKPESPVKPPETPPQPAPAPTGGG